MKINQLHALLFLSFFISFQVSAQQINLKAEDAIRFKEKQVIVVTTGDSIVDAILKEAIELKWRFSDSIQYMDLSSSNNYVKIHPNEFIRLQLNLFQAEIVHLIDNGHYKTEISRRTYGEMLKLFIFEDDPKIKFGVGLQSNTEFSEEIIFELIQRACGVIEGVEEMGSWNKLCMSKRTNSQEMIQSKTLLIPLDYVKNLSDSTQFKSDLPCNVQFVPSSFIQEKIKESNDQYMYMVAIEEVVNYHMHFICTTKSSDVLAIAARLVQGPGDFKDESKHMYFDLKTFRKLIDKL
jgi:hypothetical protein